MSTSSSTSLPPGVSQAADETYPGRVYFFATKENLDALLLAGYTQIKVMRRIPPATQQLEVTSSVTRIQLQSGVYNYSFLDENAKIGYKYEAVLLKNDVNDTPLAQGEQDAVDASFETLLTIDELIENYLFGQEGVLTNDAGVPFPDSVYAHYIRAGIAKFEQKTSLRLLPKRFVDKHDYFQEDWRVWNAIKLDEFPVISTVSGGAKLIFPGATSDNPTFTYPDEWLRLDTDSGHLHFVPDAAGPTAGALTQLSYLFRREKFVPQAIQIEYYAGFELGQVPANLKDMVGKEASAGPLNLGGDLIGGAGIASQSISMDGLSTNVNTTSSATNAGFGARLIQYNKELKEAYPEVLRYYKGLRMVVG